MGFNYFSHRASPFLPQKATADYEHWLRPVPWQLFVTLTFAYQVSDAQANRIFAEFIDRVERHLRAPITYVRGDEKRYSGCGKSAAPRHYHLVMASTAPLPADWLRATWEAMAGRRQNGAGGAIRQYDPDLGGIGYVLKMIGYDGGEWTPRNLDLVLPAEASVGGGSKNHRERRLDGRLLQAAMLPKGETGKALQAISEAYGVSLASLYRRLQDLGTYRMEARWGWDALARWERRHRTIAKLLLNNVRAMQQIFYQRRYLAEEIRKFMARTYSDRQLARYLNVTTDWIGFMADVLHKLHREPNGRFSGKELERFLKEDWYLIKGQRLIQRNNRLLKRTRAEAARNVPATKVAKILLRGIQT